MKFINMITPADTLHGSLGIGAVLNGVWLDWFDPTIQIAVTIGGAVYLYYMIRAKRMEWLQRRKEYESE